uniref:HECT domain-containing protein n=1 Tax=Labrus bergylta TaxID=56723 RepID=A0A3Q3FD95_9LABR
SGGSGQTRLSVIPPEAEGYNTAFKKIQTGGGKNTIYIVPLKDELDTSPLPADAHEFHKMPKATCKVCGSGMPLQVLAVHIKSCVEQQSSGDDYDLHGEVFKTLHRVIASFAHHSLHHASIYLFSFFLPFLSLDDVMRAIAHAVYTFGKNFDIAVSRQSMFERGLVQWQRQEKASPANQLRVLFLGEAGIDTRALRKEFLTGMIAGIEQKFFEKGSNGGRPNYSLSDLDKGNFRYTVGEIMASSLAQGGPAPNFIVLWCYKVLCTGYLNFDNLDKDNVGDVEAATETTIQSLTEEILNCGYTGLIHVEKREEIIRAIVLHAHLRLLPILLQIRDGLKLYGLLEIMAKYPSICQPLFVPALEMKVGDDADFIISVCQADFSERGTNREHLEVTLMNHLQDFLQELEQGKKKMLFCDRSLANRFHRFHYLLHIQCFP